MLTKEQFDAKVQADAAEHIQELYLKLIECDVLGGTGVDGAAIAQSLTYNRELWKYCLPVCALGVGMALRDMYKGETHFDALYIIPADDKATDLMVLAQTWKASECDWLKGREAAEFLHDGNTTEYVLRVWWD